MTKEHLARDVMDNISHTQSHTHISHPGWTKRIDSAEDTLESMTKEHLARDVMDNVGVPPRTFRLNKPGASKKKDCKHMYVCICMCVFV